MALPLVAPLEDIVLHNAFDITLIKHQDFIYERDRAIWGAQVTTTIRGYIFPSGQESRTFLSDGEYAEYVINVWVSNNWLLKNSITISIHDYFLYDGNYYGILDIQDIKYQGLITNYEARKLIGLRSFSTLPGPTDPVATTTYLTETIYEDFYNNFLNQIEIDKVKDFIHLQSYTIFKEQFNYFFENFNQFVDNTFTDTNISKTKPTELVLSLENQPLTIIDFLENNYSLLVDNTLTDIVISDSQFINYNNISLEPNNLIELFFYLLESKVSDFSDNTLTNVDSQTPGVIVLSDDNNNVEWIFYFLETSYTDMNNNTLTNVIVDSAGNAAVLDGSLDLNNALTFYTIESQGTHFTDNTLTNTSIHLVSGYTFLDEDITIKVTPFNLFENTTTSLNDGVEEGTNIAIDSGSYGKVVLYTTGFFGITILFEVLESTNSDFGQGTLYQAQNDNGTIKLQET